jgi:hypothetical protein
VPEGGYVSRRLLQLVMPVFPDRRMFRIHDPEANPDGPGSPLPPIGVLVSANREQLWVGSLQQDIDVRLVLEEWDGQPLLPDAWDEEGKARLYLRGQLSIDMGSAGTAVSRLRLSGGVGNYEVRVYARYREAVVQMYAELFNQHKDPLSDEFQREKRKLEGVERYLVQLWRDSLPAPPRLGTAAGPDARADVLADGQDVWAGVLAAGVVIPLALLVVLAGCVPGLVCGAVFDAEAFVAAVFVVVDALAGALVLWAALGPGCAGALIVVRPEAGGVAVDLGPCARKGIMA